MKYLYIPILKIPLHLPGGAKPNTNFKKKTYYNHRLGTVNNINNNNREHYFEKHSYILKLRYGSSSPLHLIICLSDFVSLSIVCFYLILHVDAFATL